MKSVLDAPVELLQKYNVQGPRYTSYPPVPFWADQFDKNDFHRLIKMGNDETPQKPLSIYIHLPFCETLCYFCACTKVITGPNHRLEDPYIETLIKEMDWLSRHIDRKRPVIQFHLGGGTPSYLNPGNIRKLVEEARKRFMFAQDCEMGIEVEPNSVSEDHMNALFDVGFNRLSIGVQDFDPTIQKALNRVQSFESTRNLVHRAQGLGFLSVNLDLIYGLPHQTPQSFAKTIEQVLEINPDRLAVYSYAFVPWMKKYQNLFVNHMPNEKQKFEIFLTALRMFLGADYEYIGMDHFAKPHDELCRGQQAGGGVAELYGVHHQIGHGVIWLGNERD